MSFNEETRRTGKCGRASECVLWRNASEVSHNPIVVYRAAHIARRYAVGSSLANVIAEHVSNALHSRASR